MNTPILSVNRTLFSLAFFSVCALATVCAQDQTHADLKRRLAGFQELYDAKRYKDAGVLCRQVAAGAEALDRHQPNLDVRELSMCGHYNAACCSALEGDLSAALSEVLLSVDNGFSDPESLRADSDLAGIAGNETAMRLVVTRIREREAASARRSPAYLLVRPSRLQDKDKAGLIVALHGAGGSPAGWRGYWQEVSEATGRFVILGRGSIEEGQGSFYWNRFWWRHEADRIASWVTEVAATEEVDPRRAILTGFSQGGGHAAAIGMLDTFDWQGVLPMGPYIQANHRKQMDVRANLKARPMLVTLGSREEGGVSDSAEYLRRLPPPGAVVRVVQGRGHELPPVAETVGLIGELEKLSGR